MFRRRSLFLLMAAAGAAAVLVAVGSASNVAPRKSGAAHAFLPAGLVPSGADWVTPGGDLAGSGY